MNLGENSYWHSLFNADSIAVIGANDAPGSWGNSAITMAIAATRLGPNRRAYAVNPNQKQVMGVTSYNSITEIPDIIDLAIIVVRAPLVPEALRQCVQKGIKAGVVISAGFSETDADGARLEAEVVDIARRGGIHFVGPNCVGHANFYSRVGSLGMTGGIRPGPLSLISQSGTVGTTIMRMAVEKGIGISKFVSTGNEADLHIEDYLEYLAEDESTHIIGAYIEGLREGRRFLALAKNITRKKPIVVIKTGSTGQSSQAAKSHTGALAGTDVVYTAAFRQAGVIRVDDDEELSDVVQALVSQPLPRSKRVGIFTVGGGFGVMAAEACEREGLKVTALQEETTARLNAILPARWSHGNPVDIVGVRSEADEFRTIVSCLHIMAGDENIDSIMVILRNVGDADNVTPILKAKNGDEKPYQMVNAENQEVPENLGQFVKRLGKPIMFVKPSIAGGNLSLPAHKDKKREYSYEYPNSQRAARTLRHLAWYSQYLNHS